MRTKLDQADPLMRERVLWVDAQIRQGAFPNYQTLMRRFRRGKRTVTAVVAFMRDELGLGIVYRRRSPSGYLYLRDEPPLIPPPVSDHELRALRLVLPLARRYLDAGTVGDLSALQDRLLLDATPSQLQEAATWESHVVFTGPPPLGGKGLDRLHTAISRNRVLVIEYAAPGRDQLEEREIEPHFLLNAAGDWLLVAWDRFREAPCTFATTRIDFVEETGETFEPRADLEPEAFTRYQFLSEGGDREYTLVLRFSPSAARLAQERTWHPTQVRTGRPDGGCELRLTVAGVGDVLRWILGFGAGVEVVEPAWMRRRVADVAAQVALKYAATGGRTEGG